MPIIQKNNFPYFFLVYFKCTYFFKGIPNLQLVLLLQLFGEMFPIMGLRRVGLNQNKNDIPGIFLPCNIFEAYMILNSLPFFFLVKGGFPLLLVRTNSSIRLCHIGKILSAMIRD